jgi:peptide/nickel transport system substrate-binding protein
MCRLAFGAAFLAAIALVLGTASAGAARYGGTLVVGLSRGDPGNLDPSQPGSTVSALVVDLAMCQRLYDQDAKGKLVPLLAAASPVISNDKLSYTVELRQGVRFNDGTPFNAPAVVVSVQRLMAPDSPRKDDFASVDSVSASGPYTVVFHLKARDSAFVGNPYSLSPTQLAKGDFGTNPVCVGPFMFDHRVVGDNVTVVKSPYYYDQKDVFLDKIVFKPMSDGPSAAAALKAGDIQALDQVSPTELEGVRQTSALQVIQAPQLGWRGIAINLRNGSPLAASAKLRQAFEEAIDRNALNRVVNGGLFQPSCTPIPPANTAWYQATKVPCTPYDPKDARRLVAASGIANPTVRLLAGGDSLQGQFIQASEAAVGINVVIDAVDGPASAARAASGDFDTRLGGSVPGNFDPHYVIYRFVVTGGAMNYSGYSNPRLDYVLANALKATDPKARAVNYRVAQQIIATDRPIIVLYNNITFAAFDTNLAGVGLTYNGYITVANAHFR